MLQLMLMQSEVLKRSAGRSVVRSDSNALKGPCPQYFKNYFTFNNQSINQSINQSFICPFLF